MSADRTERGSALLLIPAGIVIVIMLGAMAVNASLSFMAERSAASTASEVANDVATLALDVEHFRTTGEYQLLDNVDTIAAERVALAQASGATGLVPGSMTIAVSRPTADTVQVVVSGDVGLLIGLPGGERTRRVQATATGTARQ